MPDFVGFPYTLALISDPREVSSLRWKCFILSELG